MIADDGSLKETFNTAFQILKFCVHLYLTERFKFELCFSFNQ